jgi:metal-responsive CopG/Arc/MetJ family transcriptional regulator
MARKQSISVSLEDQQVEYLNGISKKTKIPRSVLVREAVESLIEKYSDQLGLPRAPRTDEEPKSI